MRDNQIFLYQRRAIPDGRDLRQRVFGKWLYPWQYGCINSSINEKNPLGLFDSRLKDLAIKLDKRLRDDGKKIREIVVNPNHERLFYVDGSHSDVWAIYERGVNQHISKKFCEYLEDNWIVENLE